MIIFDGQKFAGEKERQLTREISRLRQRGVVLKMISILADNTPESQLYVSLKAKFAQKIGAIYEIHHFDGAATETIIDDIQEANCDSSVHGIMVQLPVVNEEAIVAAISPEKDVDCLTPANLGLILSGQPRVLPATVKAVMEILRNAEEEAGRGVENKWLAGQNVVIIGASIIVGKPLAILLSDLGATVTICRSRTVDLTNITRQADILISATGMAGLVTKEMVKPGAKVIDVGISKLLRGGKFRVLGDVEKAALERASFLTPVPGGVGPVTVTSLFENLLELAEGLR
jgi:methylenetetrahydrofolate dehydrogenase (NADP+)/methenyltetrahydrofolate cyclohydrolase